MSQKYKVRNPEALYFITITVIDWVDLISRPVYKHIIVESLQYCKINKGLIIYAYVIMPSHLHLIVQSKEPFKLEDTIRDFKKFTSKELINAIKEYPESRREWLLNKFTYAAGRINKGVNYKVWQDGYHPVELTTNEMKEQRLNYIHNNPVEEEIVINTEDYKYSSATNYAYGMGVLEIEKI
ncbi:MAG: transposase [Bacteroidota bacterium]|nr:MAG: transposase [Bacteroidota bacterium]